MELNLVPLVGRAVTKVVFTRQLCAQKDFKQPACSWVSCVLILLVVWPEVSQHWRLQAVGREVWMRKWWLSGGLNPMKYFSELPPPGSLYPVSHSQSPPLQETLKN